MFPLFQQKVSTRRIFILEIPRVFPHDTRPRSSLALGQHTHLVKYTFDCLITRLSTNCLAKTPARAKSQEPRKWHKKRDQANTQSGVEKRIQPPLTSHLISAHLQHIITYPITGCYGHYTKCDSCSINPTREGVWPSVKCH